MNDEKCMQVMLDIVRRPQPPSLLLCAHPGSRSQWHCKKNLRKKMDAYSKGVTKSLQAMLDRVEAEAKRLDKSLRRSRPRARLRRQWRHHAESLHARGGPPVKIQARS